MTPGRFENRERFFKKLVAASPIGQSGSGYKENRCCARWTMRIGC